MKTKLLSLICVLLLMSALPPCQAEGSPKVGHSVMGVEDKVHCSPQDEDLPNAARFGEEIRKGFFDKDLKEGHYNEDLKSRGAHITHAEAVEDIKQLFSTLQRVHPDLLAKVSFKDYLKLRQQTLNGVVDKLNEDSEISINDLTYLLCHTVAFFRDGHTSIRWFGKMPGKNSTYPSFVLGFDNGRFIITSSANKGSEGLEIDSVNGEPILEFLRPILGRISGETLAFKANMFTAKQALWYSFSDLCGGANSLALTLRDTEGKESNHNVKVVSLDEFERLIQDVPASRHELLRRKGAHVSFFDSENVAYFVYPSFIYNKNEKKKIDGIFEEIRAKGSKELIIDIRGNGGGNSRIGDYIFNHLYDRKFRQFSNMRVKLSAEILSSKDENLVGAIPDDIDAEGLIITWQFEESVYPEPRSPFEGRVFLLVDNGTFSSATAFTALIRDYGVGTILGYETGGVPTCFGDQYPFVLKNSGISCHVSWKQFFNPKPRPGDDEHGIIPDIPITHELLRPYQSEGDSVLAYMLDHIKKTR